ncbi:porin [Luteimonas marina]|uniref:porin n=1 Tax=Luteimonas marina TaxID=488485 RepID=UPI00192D6F01|nr:porin [Luteimonas marina]
MHATMTAPVCARRRRLAAPLSLLCLLCTPAAQAVEFEAGDWKIDVGGFINAYYTYTDCGDEPVGGLALAGQALGCGGQDARSTIGNGLLPNALVTKFSTEQSGYDIGGTIAIMAHTATSSAIAPNSGVDVRQAFFTVGNADIGTFKLGRDYGVFGANAILTDMTLLGVGAPIQATQRGRVTLGHIGAGYSYLGHYGQMAWTSPAFGGGNVTLAVMSPVDNGGTHDSGSAPQLQAQYAWSGEGFKVWIGGKQQKFESTIDGMDDFTMSGAELGASLTAGRFSALANVQSGKGLGILSDGDQLDTKSSNWLVQGTFAATEKLKLGANYGISRNRDETPATGGLESNANATVGGYYQLTPGVTLALELGQTRSEAFDGTTVEMNGASFGGIIFF